MRFSDHVVIRDHEYGYRRLDPMPSNRELAQFYQSHYYDLIRKGGRAPEIRRLMSGGLEAERERAWLRDTLYSDIEAIFAKFLPGKRILDIGCGTGELALFLQERGFYSVGIEPSSEAADIARSAGLETYQMTIEEYADYFQRHQLRAFDGLTLINVLEHVPNPSHLIQSAKLLLAPRGVLCVRVPNDFSELQTAAQEKLGCPPWWVAIPDHVNYFDFSSLESFLTKLGFRLIYSQGDFPMELFLLMGEIYLGNQDIGTKCHLKRMSFDTSLPGDLRRKIYHGLAQIGVGRSCLVFAEKLA